MANSINFLYRGQANKADILRPQEIFHKDIDRKLSPLGINLTHGIWASPDRDITMIMGALGGKVAFDMKYKKDERYVVIRDPFWEQKLDLNQKFYLYTLPADKFIKIDEDEYISDEEITPIKVEEFSVIDALKMHKIYIPAERKF